MKKTEIELLKNVPDTKMAQNVAAAQIIDAVTNGNVNPMEADVLLKSLENILKAVRTNGLFKECLQDEVDKYPEKSFSFNGANYTRSTRKVYQYGEDPIWNEINEKKKEREGFLKNIPEGGAGDPITGELIHRPSTKKTDVLTIRFE